MYNQIWDLKKKIIYERYKNIFRKTFIKNV